MQVEKRRFRRQLDPDEQYERDCCDDRQAQDEGRAEPVVLVAFLQHRLQAGEPDRHGGDSGPVAGLQERQVHRLVVEREPQHDHHQDAGHEIDVEDILPAPVLGEIAADRRTDGRREGRRDGEQRQADRLPVLGQERDDDGEGHRDQHAAGEALDGSQHDHLAEVAGKRAGDREDEEQHRIDDQVAAHGEDARQPAGQRDDDDLGDEVGGGDPAAVVKACADRALDVGERRVDDLDVEHRHEGAERRGGDGHPYPGVASMRRIAGGGHVLRRRLEGRIGCGAKRGHLGHSSNGRTKDAPRRPRR